MLISVKLLAKNGIGIFVLRSIGTRKSSKLLQSRSKVEIPDRARREERLSWANSFTYIL